MLSGHDSEAVHCVHDELMEGGTIRQSGLAGFGEKYGENRLEFKALLPVFAETGEKTGSPVGLTALWEIGYIAGVIGLED